MITMMRAQALSPSPSRRHAAGPCGARPAGTPDDARARALTAGALLVGGLLASLAALALDGGENYDTARKLEADPTLAAEEIAAGPKVRPGTNLTSFEDGLRCMDKLFAVYGIRDVSLLLEDIPDPTSKVKSGTRAMFMSAVSRMTQRSHALRLVPYVDGSIVYRNRQDFLNNVTYVLQGSVTQLDESIVKRQRDGSICLGPFCMGVATSDSYNALGVDFNIIRASDLSMLPGVTAKNSVLIIKRGAGADGELNVGKFGLNFNLTYSASEGTGQGLRVLTELSAIELAGKLTRIPYWNCLGSDIGNREVASEVDDWWASMMGEPPELYRWLQTQMIARGLYTGPVNGQLDDDLRRAVRVYKGVLGLSPDTRLDVGFLRAYLAADHPTLRAAAHTAMAAAVAADAARAPAAAAPAASGTVATPPASAQAAPAVTRIEDRRGARVTYADHEYYEFDVTPGSSGYLYCWLIAAQQPPQQFFPLPHAGLPVLVKAGSSMAFPGNLGMRFYAPKSGMHETIACGVSPQNLGAEPGLQWPVAPPFDATLLRDRFSRLAGSGFSFGVYDVLSK